MMKFKAYILLGVLFATILVCSTTAVAEKSKDDHDQTAGEKVEETADKAAEDIFCRFGCCFRGRFGCIRCCKTAGEAIKETNGGVANTKEPEGSLVRCRFGCCLSNKFGCIRCCRTEHEYEERKGAAASGDGNN